MIDSMIPPKPPMPTVEKREETSRCATRESAKVFTLVAYDHHPTDHDEDGLVGGVTVTPHGDMAGFDIYITPHAWRHVQYLQGLPITEDNPRLPRMFYKHYELFKGTPVREHGVDRLLEIAFTQGDDGRIGVTWTWLSDMIMPDVRGVHAILNMLSRDHKMPNGSDGPVEGRS